MERVDNLAQGRLTTPSAFRNRILSTLPERELVRVRALLRPVSLPKGFSIARGAQPISYIYFPEDAICAMEPMSRERRGVGAALIGREGVTPAVSVAMSDLGFHDIKVIFGGTGNRLDAISLLSLTPYCPHLMALAHRFAQNLATQTSYALLAHSAFKIHEMVARFLLMVHDRLSSINLPLVHEDIAEFLGVRRASVTEALHVLEGNHYIRGTRGSIDIVDRQGLENLAGGSYGDTEAEYAALFPKQSWAGSPVTLEDARLRTNGRTS